MIYFDTSYLAKCYVIEEGSIAVRELAARDGHVVCCAYGRVELVAALHRKFREGGLAEEQFRIVIRQLDYDDAQGIFTWFPVTPSLLAKSCHIFNRIPPHVYLRSGDAVHLVCARDNGFEEIYSNDRHLLAAAPQFDLKGINILSS